MEDPQLYDWLVVIFMHEMPGPQMIDQTNMRKAIEAAGGGGNILVFLILDAFVRVEDGKPAFVLSVYKLENPGGGCTWCFDPVKSKDLVIPNPDRHCWERAFEYIYKNYFAERNMLITFSDGQAFGINFDSGRIARPPHVLDEAFVSFETPPQPPVFYSQYYILDKKEVKHLKKKDPKIASEIIEFANGGAIRKKHIQDYCKNLEILWIDELARALAKYVPSNIDVFLMCNCYMQLFDNGYLLSEKVKFLVAAEGYMFSDCYDFGRLMKRLVYCPEVPSEVLIRGIIHDLKQKYIGVGYGDYLSESSFFANRLKFYALALKVFESLIADLLVLLEDDPVNTCTLLKSIRDNAIVVTGGGPELIDAELWVKSVCDQIRGLKKRVFYRQQFTLLKAKVVICKLAEKDGTTGISIYFPSVLPPDVDGNVNYCAYFDDAIPSLFKKISKWNDFLVKYFKVLASLPPAGDPAGGGGAATPTIDVIIQV